jgi:hypothetical protein
MTDTIFDSQLAVLKDQKAALDVLLTDAPAGHVFYLDDLEDIFPGMRRAIRIYQALGATFGTTALLRVHGAPGAFVVQKVPMMYQYELPPVTR